MPVKKVKVWVLKNSLYLDGVPYVVGDAVELPEHMLNEWLALGLVSLEPPAPAKVVLRGAIHKMDPNKTAAGHPVKPGTAAGKSTAGGGTVTEKKP